MKSKLLRTGRILWGIVLSMHGSNWSVPQILETESWQRNHKSL